MLDNLLIYRLAIFNLCGAAIAFWGYERGLIAPLFDQDATRLTYIIVALFLLGMVSVFQRGMKLSRHLNRLKAADRLPDRMKFNKLRDGFNATKFGAKTAHIDDMGKWLVLLGLLGTVLGFRWSLSGVDVNSFSSASGTQDSLVVMLGGVFIAQGTTIVSIVTALWLDVNRRMLATAITLAGEFGR